MAPTVPKSKSKHKAVLEKPSESALADFHSTKRDKRLIKQSIFKSRIEKTNQKPKKRRRPLKKLVTNLESLADALPDGGDKATNEQANIIRHRSVKTRPGATKRKEKQDKMERERFAKNMAQMAERNADNTTTQPVGSSSRWAALRSFIAQTLEQKNEFKAK